MAIYLGTLLGTAVLAALAYAAAYRTLRKRDRPRLLKYLIWALVAVNATHPVLNAVLQHLPGRPRG